ncbi:flavin reductase family protein [Solwaraspora sp. WMMA2056]|uniref:flavin reductase family protein n=1 Tax=Solwaraspora sp. WMMA2056 TaxID=3015161 RepID=UPI00259B01E9|nr:flavin reductase family protein [Solwaraspora sp. WMMA2056]WJK43249.1 flavin reductase family protein [Solwaraspora sp. WMMA2056]
MNVDHPPPGEVLDPGALRQVFGTFATGVTVVTVGGGQPHGMTANSFASVSLDPPLVLICVDRQAVMHECLVSAGAFAVSVLAADQEPVARHFANRWRPLGQAQFDAVAWRPGPASGAPLIDGALAHLECGLWRAYDGGDHTIFTGRLLSAIRHGDDEPMLFLRGRFRQLDPRRDEVPT